MAGFLAGWRCLVVGSEPGRVRLPHRALATSRREALTSSGVLRFRPMVHLH